MFLKSHSVAFLYQRPNAPRPELLITVTDVSKETGPIVTVSHAFEEPAKPRSELSRDSDAAVWQMPEANEFSDSNLAVKARVDRRDILHHSILVVTVKFDSRTRGSPARSLTSGRV
jgi:hypothetical protein